MMMLTRLKNTHYNTRLRYSAITLEINIPGSVMPKGWLVWPRPPTILIPSEPFRFVTLTCCAHRSTLKPNHLVSGKIAPSLYARKQHQFATAFLGYPLCLASECSVPVNVWYVWYDSSLWRCLPGCCDHLQDIMGTVFTVVETYFTL